MIYQTFNLLSCFKKLAYQSMFTFAKSSVKHIGQFFLYVLMHVFIKQISLPLKINFCVFFFIQKHFFFFFFHTLKIYVYVYNSFLNFFLLQRQVQNSVKRKMVSESEVCHQSLLSFKDYIMSISSVNVLKSFTCESCFTVLRFQILSH